MYTETDCTLNKLYGEIMFAVIFNWNGFPTSNDQIVVIKDPDVASDHR